MDYDKLVELVLSNPVLTDAVRVMVATNGSLDLVRTDWREVLRSSPGYSNLTNQEVKYSQGTQKKNVVVKSVIGMANQMNMTVVGYWYIGRPTDEEDGDQRRCRDPDSLFCRSCEPLAEIGELMRENQRAEQYENCRMFVPKCSGNVCAACRRALDGADAQTRRSNNWCVVTTRMYDGERVTNQFKSVMVENFGRGNCLGVLNLQVTSVFCFGDGKYKIAGVCKNMVLFREQTLLQVADADHPDVSSLPRRTRFEAGGVGEEFVECVPEEETI